MLRDPDPARVRAIDGDPAATLEVDSGALAPELLHDELRAAA